MAVATALTRRDEVFGDLSRPVSPSEGKPVTHAAAWGTEDSSPTPASVLSVGVCGFRGFDRHRRTSGHPSRREPETCRRRTRWRTPVGAETNRPRSRFRPFAAMRICPRSTKATAASDVDDPESRVARRACASSVPAYRRTGGGVRRGGARSLTRMSNNAVCADTTGEAVEASCAHPAIGARGKAAAGAGVWARTRELPSSPAPAPRPVVQARVRCLWFEAAVQAPRPQRAGRLRGRAARAQRETSPLPTTCGTGRFTLSPSQGMTPTCTTSGA